MMLSAKPKTKLAKFYKKVSDFIIGPSSLELEHRFFNSIAFIALVVNFIAAIANLLLGLSSIQTYLTIMGVFIYSFLFLYSRFIGIFKHMLVIFYVPTLILMAFIWFDNEGLEGTIPYIYFLIFSSAIILSKSNTRLILISLFSIQLATLIVVEYYFPEMVNHYSTRSLRYYDVGFALFYSLIINSFMVGIIMKNYNDKKQKAEESDRLKTAFLANMSHEIRTPLNGIIGFAELLDNPSLSEEKRKEYIGIIDAKGTHLLNLVNDILDISKIEAGQMKLQMENIELNVLFNDLYIYYTGQLMQKRIETVQLEFHSDLPANINILYTAPMRLRQILDNLISNAIKNTRTGKIELQVSLKTPELLEFYVADTGIGLPSDMKEKIFSRFMQVDNITAYSHEGAGLGLSITKSFVELLGGKIWVESKEGEGCKFIFTHPIRK